MKAGSVTSRATARAFARATATIPAAGSPGGCSSAMWLGRTVKASPSRARSSWRRGEAEARMREGVPLR